MSSIHKLPLEQLTKEEAAEQKISWNSGLYSFLLTRTKEKFKHKGVLARRSRLESQYSIAYPEITDEMLKALYEFACLKYLNKCKDKYGLSSGFGKTPSEKQFLNTLATVIKNNSKLKHLEIYPSQNYSKDLPPDFKMVVGNYVPDFLIFGIKIKESSAVAIEINGDSHIDKWKKDELRANYLRQLKIFTFEIPNDQVKDINFITVAFLKMYRLRNGSFNQQILRAKRLIWVKTIACQLSLSEIEALVINRFSTKLNLREESIALLRLKNCPRKIQDELNGFATKYD